MRAKRSWVAVAVGLVALVVPASASGTTQIGQTFAPDGGCAIGVTNIQSTSPGSSYAAPSPGVITSWSYHAPGVPSQVKFKVARPAGGTSFTTVGQGALETPTQGVVNTYPVRISVQAGDVIGLFVSSGNACFDNSSPPPGYAFRYLNGDPQPGTTATYLGPVNVPLDVSAVLEPDCDSDGLGDETQDTDIPATIQACDPNAPQTTITGGPKNVVKTKKKRAKVTFTFTSSEPGTFECSLDGSPFAPCSSPSTHRVKAGRRKPKQHTFQVRAIDAAGNPDPAPAVDEFKAKRKKKRKK
jgi:hypothetical protein